MKIWRKIIAESLNDEAVYRTAPATPGLLKRGAVLGILSWVFKRV